MSPAHVSARSRELFLVAQLDPGPVCLKEFSMRGLVSAFVIALAFCAQLSMAQNTTPLTSQELASRTLYRRAVDAVIWGVPVVSLDMMRQAYFRDGKAEYNDIIWWPKGATWKNQSLATNTIVRYIYFFSNTKKDGPVVFELPPAVAGVAGFYGTIMDAWQVPLTDVGVGGKGGKYLLLPPDFKGEVPSGYIPMRLKDLQQLHPGALNPCEQL